MNRHQALINEIVEQAKKHGAGMVFTSSLGKEDQAVTALLAAAGVSVRIVSLDTGRHFPEYYDLVERTERTYQLNIELVSPEADDLSAYAKQHGINGFYKSVEARKACCEVRKIIPLRKVLSGATLWVTGLRAAQSEHRSAMERFEFDHSFSIAKYNPLLDWSDADLEAFIESARVPVNPLHARGYLSIGCAPCTRPVSEGEHPRNGRWWWESSKKECGLHRS